MECSCCQSKAKYDVDGDKVCGRHLAKVVDMHLDMTWGCKVEKIEKAD